MRPASRKNTGSALIAIVLACAALSHAVPPPAAEAAAKKQRADLPLPPKPHLVASRKAALEASRSALVEFDTAPFPYTGKVPRSSQPFLDIDEGGRKGHTTAFGRRYWQDTTYSDRRVLLHIPKGFDIRKPCLMVVYFHGHGATLERDVRDRQRVAAQLTASGLNAVLVAPQLAVDARDSSAGKFWQPGAFGRFTGEAAQKLARLLGDKKAVRTFAGTPIVVVAYSGGFNAAAWSIDRGGLRSRVKGVVLMDALYGETAKFVSWIASNRNGFFLSTYLGSTRARNAELARILTAREVAFSTGLNGRIAPGNVLIIPGPEGTNHRDFVTRAWAPSPLADVFSRIEGFAR